MHAHSQDIINRDVKEGNIFLELDRRGLIRHAILADWGLATFVPQKEAIKPLNRAFSHSFCTIDIQPPEVAQALEVERLMFGNSHEKDVESTLESTLESTECAFGPCTDVWGFGVVLANILTGCVFYDYITSGPRKAKIAAKYPGAMKKHHNEMKVVLLHEEAFYYWFGRFLLKYKRSDLNWDLYVGLINMCIVPKAKRASAADVFNALLSAGPIRAHPAHFATIADDVCVIGGACSETWKKHVLFMFYNFNRLYGNPEYIFALFQSVSLPVLNNANEKERNELIMNLIPLFLLIDSVFSDNRIDFSHYAFYWKYYGLDLKTLEQKKAIKTRAFQFLSNGTFEVVCSI